MRFCGAGVVSVFSVDTFPEVRGQGIGAAITLIPYHDARVLGYRYGVLFFSELGISVYQPIGFMDTGLGISLYLGTNLYIQDAQEAKSRQLLDILRN